MNPVRNLPKNNKKRSKRPKISNGVKILAIETSCDETAISILNVRHSVFNILSNVVSSQVKIHAKWGGIVPSLAKREHLKNLPLVLKKALKQAGFKSSNYLISNSPNIDLIAVVNGPGLEPALWTGINFAKELAKEWNKPLIAINHMEGHLFSVFLPKDREILNLKSQISKTQFPIIALLVSGGHTELVLVKDWLKYKILGQTRDDAAGEAFDKVAKMLGLGYPGGPAISQLASNYRGSTSIIFPRPMINTKDYDFSFSGLKTAVLYKTKELAKLTPKTKSALCAEFQQAVIDVLVSKTLRAAKEYKAKTIIMAGGVSANEELRKQFQEVANRCDRKHMLLFPEIKFTGDNAAMVALAAYFRRTNKKEFANIRTLKADGNLRIS